ncbi:MAG: ribosome biogenesis GTPase Der [Gammaproteobacteria bacterium]
MLPVIALVGRPNVGKSTLFNTLTRSRDALVADQPGLTRDRQYGFGVLGSVPYLVVDTGGLSGDTDGLDGLMAQQTQRAIEEADFIIFMVDGREGLSSSDQQVAQLLRRYDKPLQLVVNKSEGLDPDVANSEFYALGAGQPASISSAHGHNVGSLMDEVLSHFPAPPEGTKAELPGIKVAIIGRPNVGKSTLVNRLVGEERVVAFDEPGTTRDSVYVPFERDGTQYTLIDTAGVRRRSRVDETIEKFSIVKTLQAIDKADVVVCMLEAREGVTEQDVRLLGLALHRGRALTLAINKWDGLSHYQRDTVRRELEVKLPFATYIDLHFISALHGSGITDVLASVVACHKAATKELPTAELTKLLEDCVQSHPPPASRGRRPKLRYAHQGGRNPQIIVIHGNMTNHIADSYRRFLENRFRKVFKLHGAPVKIEFKSGKNPFAGRKNKLTDRQKTRKKRLMKHVKRK